MTYNVFGGTLNLTQSINHHHSCRSLTCSEPSGLVWHLQVEQPACYYQVCQKG